MCKEGEDRARKRKEYIARDPGPFVRVLLRNVDRRKQ